MLFSSMDALLICKFVHRASVFCRSIRAVRIRVSGEVSRTGKIGELVLIPSPSGEGIKMCDFKASKSPHHFGEEHLGGEILNQNAAT
jgi:hypothetical protein